MCRNTKKSRPGGQEILLKGPSALVKATKTEKAYDQ
jgi:hypothetical protein